MDPNIFMFILVGFLAQLIDGALGMAYGVSSNTLLLSFGFPPASASASIHLAEVFTTAVSGVSHWRLGNIDWDLIKKLALPGMVGGILGAYILSALPGDVLKPYISMYLLVMGVIIILKALNRKHVDRKVTSMIMPLGLIGGLFDALGGGGWGPIVTTTLVARGNHPRFTVGSVNLAEFFVTVAESVAFIVLNIAFAQWKVILGLLIGGAIAAPLAAYLTRKLPVRLMMGMVGLLIIILSIRTILLAFL